MHHYPSATRQIGQNREHGDQGAQAAAAIVNDQFQAVFAPDALLFQLAQESQPACGILTVGQVPGQDFLAVAIGPDPQGDQEAALAAAFDRAAPVLAISPPLTGGAQLRESDGVQLEDGRGATLIGARGQTLQLMQALQQGALP